MNGRGLRTLARVALAISITASVGVVASAQPAAASAAITGGGSSFAALEIDQWHADTAVKPFSLTVNYTAQGSSFGRGEFASGNLDFGASDITYVSYELPNLQQKRCQGKSLGSCFVYVPVSAGGVSFMFNLTDASGRRVSDLKLTRRAACKIFTGAITRWNDPELVQFNPSLSTISREIVPTIRADGAGESYVFSEFCIAVAPDVWQAFIQERLKNDAQNVADDFKAGQPVSNWPQNWGRSIAQPYADGVANNVASPDTGRNSIAYVAAGYAKVRSFPVASVQNAAGVFTQPDEDNVTVALGYAKARGDGTFTLNFTGADRRAYFPSTYSYILAQTAGWDRSKGETLGRFLCYAVSQGQVIAPTLRYARLSAPLVSIAINSISQIPGAPDKNHCYLATAPPPPPPPSVQGGNIPPSQTPGAAGPSNSSGGNANRASAATTSTAPTASAGNASAVKASASAAETPEQRQRSIDGELADARVAGRQSSHGAQIWLLVVGIGIAWAISAGLSRRQRLS
jgi:ABC-type phosphate transport system substrate-binding protein